MPYNMVAEPESWVSVSGFGEDAAVETPKTDYVPQTERIIERESMTGMWLLLALAFGSSAYMYMKLRKAGIPLLPPKPLSDLGHSGRTYYGVFPHHRGYGHHRLSTGKWHYHKR